MSVMRGVLFALVFSALIMALVAGLVTLIGVLW